MDRALKSDGDVQRIADRRLRASSDFTGTERRAHAPSFTEAVEVVEAKAKPWFRIGLGIATLIVFLTTYGILNNPLETKAAAQDAHAALRADIDKSSIRIDRLEGVTNDTLATVRESQELMLMERIQRIDDDIKLATESVRVSDLRQQRNEASQMLSKVRAALGRPN